MGSWGRIGPRYLELILYRTYADLRAEASRTYISFLWWVIEPVMYMASFYVVFSLLLERQTPNFVAFLLVGLIVWKWFASAVVHSGGALPNNAAVMQQIYLPKIIFPLVTNMTDAVKFAFVFVILLVALLIHGGVFGLAWLALPLLLAVQFLLILGVSCLYAALVPVAPDLRIIADNLLLVMMFMSGIFFDASLIPPDYQPYFFLNPMATLIDAFREVLLHGRWPDWSRLVMVAGCGFLLLVVAVLVLTRLDRDYPRLSVQ